MGEQQKKPNWEAGLKAYVDANKWRILADIHHTLARTPVPSLPPLDSRAGKRASWASSRIRRRVKS